MTLRCWRNLSCWMLPILLWVAGHPAFANENLFEQAYFRAVFPSAIDQLNHKPSQNQCPVETKSAQPPSTSQGGHLSSNVFDKYKHILTAICTPFGIVPLKTTSISSEGNACKRFVADYFEIASPYCSTAKTINEQHGTNSCQMFVDYISDQFNGKKARDYLRAVRKINLLIDKLLANDPNSKRYKSIFDIFLDACDGDKTMALTISVSFPGHPGISSREIGNFYDSWSGMKPGEIGRIHENGKFLQLKQRGLSFLPSSLIATGVSEEKPDHFYARALLSRLLFKRGYRKDIAIKAANASEYVYFGLTLGEKAKAATSTLDFFRHLKSDLETSRAGSAFGVSDDPVISADRSPSRDRRDPSGLK